MGGVGGGPSCFLFKGFPFRGAAGGQRLAPAPLILRNGDRRVQGFGTSVGDPLSPGTGLQGLVGVLKAPMGSWVSEMRPGSSSGCGGMAVPT